VYTKQDDRKTIYSDNLIEDQSKKQNI